MMKPVAEHPVMFRDDDPLLAVVRRHALALPEAQEKVSHGRPAFFTTKVFAYFGGSVRRGPGEFERHDAAVMVLPDAADEPAQRQDPRFWTPAYLGPSGGSGSTSPTSTRPSSPNSSTPRIGGRRLRASFAASTTRGALRLVR